MSDVIFLNLGVNYNVIKVYYYKDIQELSQHSVDVSLPYCWFIDQTKKYNQIFLISKTSSESCLLLITFFDPDPIECSKDIKFQIPFSFLETIHKFFHQQYWVIIFHCDIVELLIINIYPEFFTGFKCKQHWVTGW